MGLAVRIARRSVFGRPGRTLFSVLGVAVGIATVVAVFTVDHVSVLSRTAPLDPSWGADWEVRPSGAAARGDARDELLRLEGVAGVAAFFQNDVRFRPLAGAAGEDDAFEPVRLIALDSAGAPSLGVYHVERGADLGRPRGVLVGRAIAESHGLEPGDPILLAAPRRAARKACVDGVLQELGGARPADPPPQPFEVAGVLAFEGIGRRSGGDVIVVDYEEGRQLLAGVFVEPQYWLTRDAGVDLEHVESELGQGFTFVRNARRAAGQMADERAFRNGVRVAGLFALVLGLFVIFHTLSMSLVERVREVGALHALGASSGQIARPFFLEALFVAITAGAVGLAGGLGLARALLLRGITTLGVAQRPVRLFEVPWRVVGTLVVLGIAIALLGSVYPILRTRGGDVLAVLRGETAGRGRSMLRGVHGLAALLLLAVVPAVFFGVAPVLGEVDPALARNALAATAVLVGLVGGLLFLPGLVGAATSALTRPFARLSPLSVRLAASSLRQSPDRIGASIAAIALVTAAFVALKGMTASLAGEIEDWGERAVVDKVWVENLPDVRLDELAAELGELPEVLGVESGSARVHVDFLLLGLAPEALAGWGPVARDPGLLEALRDTQGLIVSRRLARQRELAVGDPVFVDTSGHGVQEFRVLAVSDDYGYFIHPDERAYAVTADRHVRRYFCLDVETTNTVAVRLREGSAPGVVEAALRARHDWPRLRVTPGRSVVALHLEDIERDFVLFDVILLLTAVLAGLGVLNGQLLAALERTKELGILRALGMTDRQVAGAVLLESGVVGLCGGLAGIAAGSLLIPLLVASLRALSGLDLPLRWAGPRLPVFLAGALLLAILAGLYPLWRMHRMDAVRAVRSG